MYTLKILWFNWHRQQLATFSLLLVATCAAGCDGQTDGWNSWELLLIIGVVLAVGVCAAGVLFETYSNKLAAENAAEEEEKRRLQDALDARKNGLDHQQREMDRNQCAFQSWSEGEKESIASARRQFEGDCERALVSLRAAQDSLKVAPPVAGTVGKYLRDNHGQGAAFGESIDVTYIAERAGFIRMKWVVRADRIAPPVVVIHRGETFIRRECSLHGEFGDHIIPGQRYLYKFVVLDEKNRELGRALCLEVKMPTKKFWETGSPENDDDEKEQRIRERFKSKFNGLRVMEELRQTYTAQVVAMHYPKQIEEWLLDQIDTLVARLLDEE